MRSLISTTSLVAGIGADIIAKEITYTLQQVLGKQPEHTDIIIDQVAEL